MNSKEKSCMQKTKTAFQHKAVFALLQPEKATHKRGENITLPSLLNPWALSQGSGGRGDMMCPVRTSAERGSNMHVSSWEQKPAGPPSPLVLLLKVTTTTTKKFLSNT